MLTDEEKRIRLRDIHFEVPILKHFDGMFDKCFIVLHPFRKKIFDDSYDYLRNYNKTYPLLEFFSWKDMLKKTGIESTERLIRALISFSPPKDSREQEEREMLKYGMATFIEEPIWDADKIPAEIMLPFLQFLRKNGYSEILTCSEPYSSELVMETKYLSEESVFTIAAETRMTNPIFVVTPDFRYCLKLAARDVPFSIFLTNCEVTDFDFIKSIQQFGYEGVLANVTTTTHWYA